MATLSVGQQLNLIKHQLISLQPDRGDYGMACLAIMFAIEEWDRFREFTSAFPASVPITEALISLARFDEAYCRETP